jgi:hypothetical protein
MGSRGVGALFGAVAGASFAGASAARLRQVVLWGFAAGALGYLLLWKAGSVWTAALCLVLAHAGGSAIWTASTTMLQRSSDDRFRGRVFSAEFAVSMFVLSMTSYGAGLVVDRGVPVLEVALWTGVALLAAGAVWLRALRLWRGAPGD